MSASAPSSGDKKNIVKMAYIYFQEGRWDKAIEEYKKLIALDPDDINTHNMLGDVYVKKGAPREAFEEYIRVSNDLSSRGQVDKAAVVNKKIAVLDSSLLPPDAQKKQNLIRQTLKAEIAMEQGDVDGAITALNEVLKLDGENLGAYAKLGELLEKKGKIPEAIQDYQMLGAAFFKNRHFKKAQEMFQRIVTLDPDNIEARSNLAQIYIKQGSESDAKKEFLVIAEHYLNAGDLENADSYAAKAIEFKSIEAHYVLGMVLFKKQKLSEAKAEFESLLRFKVNHVGALVNLGKVYLELNQADKAAENIQKALKIEKDNLIALEASAELSVKKGNKNEAVTTLLGLVDRYTAKGDSAKALDFARSVSSLDENSIPGFTKLGDLLKQAGDTENAAGAYYRAVQLFDKLGKKDLASEYARKTLEMNARHSEAQNYIVSQVVAGPSVPPAPSAPQVSPAAHKAPTADAMDMELEIIKPAHPAPAIAPEPPPAEAHKPETPEETAGTVDELEAQVAIADKYAKQGLVEEAIGIFQDLIEQHPGNSELKEKLNHAYAVYVKSGEDVLGALEAEKKAKEDEAALLRAEMEKKARVEAEKKAREEIDHRIKEETERKAREESVRQERQEMEREAREEAARRVREEAERKVREEMESRLKMQSEQLAKEDLEKRFKEEALRKAKEEAEQRAREEAERKAQQAAVRKLQEEREKTQKKPMSVGGFTPSRTEPPSKGEAVIEEGRDEFMTIAVADIYTRQGLYEEASKIYRRILQMEPSNIEAKKKLTDLENLIKSKSEKASPPPAAPAAPTKTVALPSKMVPPPETEKDSGGKKKINRVGYV